MLSSGSGVYAVTAGLVIPPPWSDRSGVLGSFARQEKVAIRRYLEFVANGVQQPSPWSMLKNQIYLGSDQFIEHAQKNISDKNIPEVPKIQNVQFLKSFMNMKPAQVAGMKR